MDEAAKLTRERKIAVRALFPDDIEAALAALPPEVIYDPGVQPFLRAILAGLDGLAVAPLPEEPAPLAANEE